MGIHDDIRKLYTVPLKDLLGMNINERIDMNIIEYSAITAITYYFGLRYGQPYMSISVIAFIFALYWLIKKARL